MRRVVVSSCVLTALLALLTACGGSSAHTSSSATPASSSAPSSSSTQPTTAGTAGPCLPGAGTGPLAATGSATVLMTDLVVQGAGCADKVTFTFKPGAGAPGYEVAYKPGPFRDAGSGNTHPVSGAAFVVVRLHPAWIADFGQPSAPLTYLGPKSILHPPGAIHVQDLELTEAFEGYVTWVVGLDSMRSLTVAASASPPSLVFTIG
jgi:hypothetical protein